MSERVSGRVRETTGGDGWAGWAGLGRAGGETAAAG